MATCRPISKRRWPSRKRTTVGARTAKPVGDEPWPVPWPTVSAVMQPDPLARHSWVWLAEGWTRCLRGRSTAETIALAEQWRALDRPFIVASPGAHDGEDDLRLGLALPDKRRIGLHLPRAAVVRSAPPPSLLDIVAQAPAAWRPRLWEVETMAWAAGVSTAVYGSLAWEYRCSMCGRPFGSKKNRQAWCSASSGADMCGRPFGSKKNRQAWCSASSGAD